MRGRLFGTLGDDRHAEPPADHFSDRLERDTLVVDGMIGAALDALFERQPVEAGGVEPMHAGPAVIAVANIGCDALLAREAAGGTSDSQSFWRSRTLLSSDRHMKSASEQR